MEEFLQDVVFVESHLQEEGVTYAKKVSFKGRDFGSVVILPFYERPAQGDVVRYKWNGGTEWRREETLR
jgi:hypothetical protein